MYFDVNENRPKRSNVYLVCGPPASGKTTYVNEHKQPGDFVLDLDVLRQALGAPAKTCDCFQAQILEIRRLLYHEIARDRICAKNVWVISGLPEKAQRLGLAKFLKAELIFLATPIDECIKRAMNDPERIDKDKQIRIIKDYFKNLS